MLGVLIAIGLVILFLVPVFMVIASGVIIYGWIKASRARKRESLESERARRVGLV